MAIFYQQQGNCAVPMAVECGAYGNLALKRTDQPNQDLP
jgi:hypothetical protein